jgi:hypothetical protein
MRMRMKFWSERLKGRNLWGTRCGWENGMDLEERDGVFWIYLAQENDCWCSCCELPSSLKVWWVGAGGFLCCLSNY